MKTTFLTPLLAGTLLLTVACSHHKKEEKKEAESETTAFATPVTQEGLDRMTSQWPESSQSAIKTLTTKYGLPSAVTEQMVVWYNTAPFKSSVVSREEVSHRFPMEHSDVLLQTVDYRVPLDKVTALSKFDGSLIIDRVKGELSARNDREEMNILALNLADKIVRGEMTVEEARREYSKNADAFAAGTSNSIVTGLTFKSEGNTSDPDSMMESQEDRSTRSRSIKTDEYNKVMED